jgi:hypothetical protein
MNERMNPMQCSDNVTHTDRRIELPRHDKNGLLAVAMLKHGFESFGLGQFLQKRALERLKCESRTSDPKSDINRVRSDNNIRAQSDETFVSKTELTFAENKAEREGEVAPLRFNMRQCRNRKGVAIEIQKDRTLQVIPHRQAR